MCSGVFNNLSGRAFHDHRKRMHELSEHCVRKIVEYWKSAGPCWVRQRNFEIKTMMEDFDFDQCIKKNATVKLYLTTLKYNSCA